MAQGTTSGNSTGHRVDRMTGFTTKVGTPVVEVLEVDSNRDVLLARGATVPTDADAGYAKGCKFIKTDGGVATTVYLNEGSATSADFNAVESSASTITSVAAGNGLTGGGTEGAVTLTVGAGDGITVGADSVSLASTAGGAGLTYTTGVLAVGAGTGITANANDVQIAAGYLPSHRVIAAGKHTTVGGDTTEVITATGALGTDLAFVQVQSGNGGPVVTALPGTDDITVLLTADPGNDDVLTWQVLRAVS